MLLSCEYCVLSSRQAWSIVMRRRVVQVTICVCCHKKGGIVGLMKLREEFAQSFGALASYYGKSAMCDVLCQVKRLSESESESFTWLTARVVQG